MKTICDGHEYTVTGDKVLECKNNYGSLVAVGEISNCGEYWVFITDGPEDSFDEISEAYHINMFPSTPTGYTVEQQLVRWYAAIS